WSTEKAFHLRSLSTDNGLSWRARRWARFIVRAGEGALRPLGSESEAPPIAGRDRTAEAGHGKPMQPAGADGS
ncbi:MAG TPA: hypothetical protein VFQ87_02230, partial [Bradyrhizobium sp.]|nr:hypothetical protein [Bradyrhizobium sp.]